MPLIDQHPTTSPAPTITPIAPTREVAPQPAAAPGPRDAGRLLGLDIARGIAVLGMAAGATVSRWPTPTGGTR